MGCVDQLSWPESRNQIQYNSHTQKKGRREGIQRWYSQEARGREKWGEEQLYKTQSFQRSKVGPSGQRTAENSGE